MPTVPKAAAQSPNPVYYYENTTYPTDPYPTYAIAVIVEGVGLELGSCYDGTTYDIASVVAGVNRFLSEHYFVYYEVSPQAYCTTAANYQSATNTVMNDIFADNSAANLNSYFEGVLMDEEERYGYAPATLENLNQHIVSNYQADENSKGVYSVNFMTEAFAGGIVSNNNTVCVQPDWSQNQYDAVVIAGVSGAPEISTPCMAQLANGSYNDHAVYFNMVTFELANPSPYNSLTYAEGKTTGTPWADPDSGIDVYNYFVP
jgi:hypothetical protein